MPRLRLSPASRSERLCVRLPARSLTRAQTILDDPAREPTVTVHDIRRAMKRWRAMLRMLTPILGDGTEALREQARDLSRKLTAARDAQSAIDAFQDAVEAGLDSARGASRRGRSQTIQSRLEALRAEGERSIWNDERRREMSRISRQRGRCKSRTGISGR